MMRFLLPALALAGLCTTARAQQAVTQKDLLGNWHIRVVAAQGIYYDAEKDSVALSDSLAELVPAGALPELKAKMHEQFDAQFAGTMSFKPDGRVQLDEKGKKSTDYYKLYSRDKVQYLRISGTPTDEGDETTVRMEHGTMILSQQDADAGLITIVLAR